MARILIVDDSELVCRTLAGLLRDAGHHADYVKTVGDALAKSPYRGYDYAVIDVCLPDAPENTNGLPLAFAMQNLQRDLRIIMMTGKQVQSDNVMQAVRRSELVAYIEKGGIKGDGLKKVVEAINLDSRSTGRWQRKCIDLRLTVDPKNTISARSIGEYARGVFCSGTLPQEILDYGRLTQTIVSKGPGSQELLRHWGRSLWKCVFSDHAEILELYGVVRKHCHDQNAHLAIRFETPAEFLNIPFEFLNQQTNVKNEDFLILQHPVSRFLYGQTPRRSPLSPKEIKQNTPLRMLLIAANTMKPDIPQVDVEIETIQQLIQYRINIPDSKTSVEITQIGSFDATVENVERVLRSGKFDIIHYAGHGVHYPEYPQESGLLLWQDDKHHNVHPVSCGELVEWLNGYTPALVFMNCCFSAQTAEASKLLTNDFLGLNAALVQAGIPSVMGYRWPVADNHASEFATAFYEALFLQGDPEIAAWWARNVLSKNRWDPTWQASILIHQA